jgi:hypothetical protein
MGVRKTKSHTDLLKPNHWRFVRRPSDGFAAMPICNAADKYQGSSLRTFEPGVLGIFLTRLSFRSRGFFAGMWPPLVRLTASIEATRLSRDIRAPSTLRERPHVDSQRARGALSRRICTSRHARLQMRPCPPGPQCRHFSPRYACLHVRCCNMKTATSLL